MFYPCTVPLINAIVCCRFVSISMVFLNKYLLSSKDLKVCTCAVSCGRTFSLDVADSPQAAFLMGSEVTRHFSRGVELNPSKP